MKIKLLLYLCIPVFIVGWWTLAFKPKAVPITNPAIVTQQPTTSAIFLPHLVQRETLIQALQGDFSLMAELIRHWDAEARILAAQNIATKRLSNEQFIRSQLIDRQLTNPSVSTIIHDDDNNSFMPQAYNHLLPQTYVAAEFLLTLVPAENLIALPAGFKEHSLHPKEKLMQIPLEINQYNSEQLFQKKPDIAFVGHYSHPATLLALQGQGIPLFTIKKINSPEEISNALLRIGAVVQQNEKAELLQIFMEAALLSFDNQLSAYLKEQPNQRLLYLNHYLGFYSPSSKSLIGTLLSRLPFTVLTPYQKEDTKTNNPWKTPITIEEIVNLQPDIILFATFQPEAAMAKLLHEPALAALPVVKNNRIHYIDEAMQENPSHFIALAYYDIVSSIVHHE